MHRFPGIVRQIDHRLAIIREAGGRRALLVWTIVSALLVSNVGLPVCLTSSASKPAKTAATASCAVNLLAGSGAQPMSCCGTGTECCCHTGGNDSGCCGSSKNTKKPAESSQTGPAWHSCACGDSKTNLSVLDTEPRQPSAIAGLPEPTPNTHCRLCDPARKSGPALLPETPPPESARV